VVEKISIERERQREVPTKSRYFTAVDSFRVKLLQVGTDLTSFSKVLTSMTLNDLKPSKYGVFSKFVRFCGATHISKVNCAEKATD